MKIIRKLCLDINGATAIEYGLIVALVSLACTIAFINLGLSLTNIFETLTNAMK